MSIRKIKITLLTISIAALAAFSVDGTRTHANSSGPSASRTGAPAIGSFGAELNCTSSGCHSTYALNSGPGTFSISGLPTYYLPDQEITVTVTMNQASRAAYGFQLTAVDAQGNRAGTFTTSDNRTQLLNGTGTFTGRRYIQHSISGISSNGANQASWTFKWRAPATPAGKITLYAAGNAANGTGTSSNDYIYTTSKSIDPLPYAAVSAASYSPTNVVSSEMISALYSVGMAAGTLAATTLPLPTQLGETTVEFQDSTGKVSNSSLFFVSEGQVNFLVPPNTPNGSATVRVKRNGTTVVQGAIEVQPVSPGIFTAASSGQGVAAAYFDRRENSNPSLSIPELAFRFNSTANAFEAVPYDLTRPNSSVYLVLFGTGLRWRSALSGISVALRGENYPALYAGEAPGYVGLDQIVIGPLPATLVGAGTVNVVVTVDGKTSNTVTVALK
ncbi:MAG: choice-of-anchor V domain-containing protein [Blastocatellia bacterium]